MTFEGARKESIRRTDVLGTTHYVVDSGIGGYMVLTSIPAKYEHAVVAVHKPEDIEFLKSN